MEMLAPLFLTLLAPLPVLKNPHCEEVFSSYLVGSFHVKICNCGVLLFCCTLPRRIDSDLFITFFYALEGWNPLSLLLSRLNKPSSPTLCLYVICSISLLNCATQNGFGAPVNKGGLGTYFICMHGCLCVMQLMYQEFKIGMI